MSEFTVNIQVAKFRTKKQQLLLELLTNKKVQKQINTFIKDAINPFVPKKSGKLRRSAIVTHNSITWGRGLKYARYQYGGEVYGPNYPGIEESGANGWRSAKKKYPTGRELGVPGVALLHPVWQLENGVYKRPAFGTARLYKFGYTTSKTQHHWDKAFTYQVKQKTNLEVTRYLKRECKKRGLKT